MLLRICCSATLVAFVVGCGGGDTPPPSDFAGDVIPPEVPTPGDAVTSADGDEPIDVPMVADDADNAAVTLKKAEWEAITADIASHEGKVVVVDLWATYCVPCRKSFPGLVALSNERPDEVVCISVSLDDADDGARALEFLEEQQAQMTNYLCTTDADRLYDEILQIGGVPAVYVYGRDGQLAKLFTGPTPEGTDHNYEEHIRPFVEELLSAQ